MQAFGASLASLERRDEKMERHISLRTGLLLLGLGAVGISAPPLAAQMPDAIYPVDNSGARFRIYTDPNTGETLQLGGFSGMAPVSPFGSGKLIQVITDRGASGDDPSGAGKCYVNPSYSPSIVTIQLGDRTGRGKIVQTLRLRKPDNEPITGITPVCPLTYENPITDICGNPLANDPDGFDPEALAAGPFGTFIISEEYMPSVAIALPSGHVVLRFAPKNLAPAPEKIRTLRILPEVFAKRVSNRGLESVAWAPSGSIYTVFQRPVANPDKATSEASRIIRVAEIHLGRAACGHGDAVRQMAYVTEEPSTDPATGKKNKLKDIYVNDMVYYAPDAFLLIERDSKGYLTGNVFAIDTRDATDVTGLEDAAGNLLAPVLSTDASGNPIVKTTLEQLGPEELAAIGVVPVTKVPVLALRELMASDATLAKLEGMTIAGGKLLLCQDNDFDLAEVAQDWSTIPATLIHQSPSNIPRILQYPLPDFTLP
jgi:hypothetical protein